MHLCRLLIDYELEAGRLLADWLRADGRLEADETGAVFQRLLFVLLVAWNQCHLAEANFADFAFDPHSQPPGENQDDLLARVVVWLGATALGLGVVPDLKLLAGDGRAVGRGMSRRYNRGWHLIQLEKWHDSSASSVSRAMDSTTHDTPDPRTALLHRQPCRNIF